jgi:hypothetical protein
MHPMIRSLVLVLLSQILREPGRELGFDLAPATDRPELVGALRELLSLPQAPSAGHVITFDVDHVGVDLAAIPIDEVLAFRKENLDAHRRYVRSVRLFVHELSGMSVNQQALALQERQEQLKDMAADLRAVAKKAWKKPVSFGLGMVGAAWTLAGGNPFGALLGGAGTLLQLGATDKAKVGSYSYLFDARGRFPARTTS